MKNQNFLFTVYLKNKDIMEFSDFSENNIHYEKMIYTLAHALEYSEIDSIDIEISDQSEKIAFFQDIFQMELNISNNLDLYYTYYMNSSSFEEFLLNAEKVCQIFLQYMFIGC